jgi:hypothetical protein
VQKLHTIPGAIIAVGVQKMRSCCSVCEEIKELLWRRPEWMPLIGFLHNLNKVLKTEVFAQKMR